MRKRVPVADVTLASEGEVSDRPRWATLSANPRDRVIFLVHGYNTKEAVAAQDFASFKRRLTRLFPPLAESIVTSAWAGRRRIGALGYMTTIPYAVATSETLLQAIDQWYEKHDTPEFVLVGHSLGCRVVMEALAAMATRPGGQPQKLKRLIVILMAAAVPVFMLEQGGRLNAALEMADAVYYLHSQFDFVLSDLFPVGQTFAGEGWFPKAVGLYGEPAHLRCAPRDMQPLNHSDYWDSESVARQLCTLLNVPVLGSARRLPAAMKPPLSKNPVRMTPRLGQIDGS